MSTFVSLAVDNESTLCAIATGDWLLQVINLKKPEMMQDYCTKFVKQFVIDEITNEQRIVDPINLFDMLLSHHDTVFEYFNEAREKGEINMNVKNTPDNNNAATSTVEVKKTYVEVHKEVEEFFTALMSILALRIESAEVAGKAAGDLCNVFKNSHEVPEFRLRLLKTLYNVFPADFPYRFPIFVTILEYAAETNQFHTLISYIKYINEWMKDWNLSASSKRQVYLILANQLKKMGMVEDAYSYLKRHVACFQDEEISILQDGATISAAVELVEDSISLRDVMYFDSIIQLDAVKYLRETPHRKLVDLLEIFIRGDTKDLENIQQANPNIFELHGLNYEECFKKLQLLSLVSLAECRSDIEISYISKTLNVSLDEAEALVVQAIGQGLLDAKIDQMNKIIHVRSTMQREFAETQWELLHSKLNNWIDGVQNLLNALNQSKYQQTHVHTTDRSDKEKVNLSAIFNSIN